MESAASIIFRVRGLPAQGSLSLLQNMIDQCLTSDERASLQFKIDVVQSYTGEGCVGFVDFHSPTPLFLESLMENPMVELQIEAGDTDLTFDRHFQGLTQLYNIKDGESITADIIAVCGLDGHAFESWRGDGNLRRMWLRDFLRTDLPYYRTMTYGYDTNLSSFGFSSILDYARELLDSIQHARQSEEERKRPLIFIAHDFGGILVAHALIKASRRYSTFGSAFSSIYLATYGIMFFGTPHRGLFVDDIQTMLATQEGRPRHKLLQQIEERSSYLYTQLDDFINILGDRKVVTFYETKQTRKLEWNTIKNCWTRSGDFVTIVEVDSAILHLPYSTETKIPLHNDHFNMIKFGSKHSQGYQSTICHLKKLERQAIDTAAIRFGTDTRPGSLESVQTLAQSVSDLDLRSLQTYGSSCSYENTLKDVESLKYEISRLLMDTDFLKAVMWLSNETLPTLWETQLTKPQKLMSVMKMLINILQSQDRETVATTLEQKPENAVATGISEITKTNE